MIVCDTCHRILEPTREACGECGTPAPPPPLTRPAKDASLAIAFEDVAAGTPIVVSGDERAFAYESGSVAAVFGRGRHVIGFDSFVLLVRLAEIRVPLPARSEDAAPEHALSIAIEAPATLLGETRDPRALGAGKLERGIVERATAAIASGEGPVEARLADLVAELAASGVRVTLVAHAAG